jgi:hypothetical protein
VLYGTKIFAGDTNLYEWGAIAFDAQLSIGINGGDTEVKSNQPVNLSIRLKNLSSNDNIQFLLPIAPAIDSDFSFEITSPTGRDISPARNHLSGSASLITIKPHESVDYKFALTEIFRFTEVGTYKIVAKRLVRKDGQVVSNTLYLNVVPGEWKKPAGSRFGF